MTIDKNLTLEGITVGTANQAVITSPVGGVVNNAIDPASGSPVQAQIVATGGAKVNISDLVVDGTGNGLAGCSWNLVGIYYEDASGVINHVVARYQCQGRTESTSVAAGKIRQFEGWKDWWFGFCQGEHVGYLPHAIALSL